MAVKYYLAALFVLPSLRRAEAQLLASVAEIDGETICAIRA
jgi:hypothetical protein